MSPNAPATKRDAGPLLSGRRKAAILAISLGPERAAAIFKHR
jgi:flagellar motor switch protein FliG